MITMKPHQVPSPKAIRDLEKFMLPSEKLVYHAITGGYMPLFTPNPGPQTEAFNCQADITGYGGAAGGGKSMLITGLAMTQHKRSLIIRQEKVSTRKFVQDIAKAKGDRDGYSSQGSTWNFTGPDAYGRVIEFAGMENPGDEEKQQGIDYDLKCVGAGTLVWMADGSRKRVEDVAVGDIVYTLTGPRRVTRTIRQTKEAVLAVTPTGQQVQGASHQLLGPAGWRSSEDDEDRQQPSHHGSSSTTPSRCACKCAGSLSPTSSARQQPRGTRLQDRLRRRVSGLGRAGRLSWLATDAETGHTIQGGGCAKHCDLCRVCAPRPSLTLLRRALASARQRLWGCAACQRVRPSDDADARQLSSLRGSLFGCRGGCCSCGGRPRPSSTDDRQGQRRPNGVEPRNPIYLLEDEGQQTRTRSRRTWSYNHPYTKETQTTDCQVRAEAVVYCDAGVLPLFDLTVEGANHYITNQGFVNRNCYDEVTQMREWQVRYTIGWVRSDDPKQRCRVLLTFNPPTTAEGRWVIKFFAPWLDPKHPKPAKDGELRYFITKKDNPDFEMPDGRHFVWQGATTERPDGDGTYTPVYDYDPADYADEKQILIIRPKSRTFITARVTDNPYYVKSGYISQLQQLPEPLRSQMLRGDFTAGVEDAAFQVIPTAWIEAAMERWYEPQNAGPMDSMGVDAARGGNMGSSMGAVGKDKMVISRRHGRWFAPLLSIKGVDVNSGSTAAAHVIKYRRDQSPVHIDVVGIGTSPFDYLNDNAVHTLGVNGAAQSMATDKSGLLKMYNLRAELYWALREALDPDNPDPIYLPDDAELLADLAAPTYKVTPRGILIEPKEDLKARLQRSPDKGDAVVMANISTPKRKVVVGPLAAASNMMQNYDEDRFRELEQ